MKCRLLIIILVTMLYSSVSLFAATKTETSNKSLYESFKENGYELYLYYTNESSPYFQSTNLWEDYEFKFQRITARLVTKKKWALELNYHHSKVYYNEWTYDYKYKELEDDNQVLCALVGKDWDIYSKDDLKLKLHLLLGPGLLIHQGYVDEYDFGGDVAVEFRTGLSLSYKIVAITLDYTLFGSDFELLANTALGIGLRL